MHLIVASSEVRPKRQSLNEHVASTSLRSDEWLLNGWKWDKRAKNRLSIRRSVEAPMCLNDATSNEGSKGIESNKCKASTCSRSEKEAESVVEKSLGSGKSRVST